MSDACHSCGAVLPEGSTCQTIFDEFLALEFTDPGYGRVHFLTVACFLVQHNGYSDEALVWIQSALRNYLEKGRSTQQLRREAAEVMEGRTKEIRRPAMHCRSPDRLVYDDRRRRCADARRGELLQAHRYEGNPVVKGDEVRSS